MKYHENLNMGDEVFWLRFMVCSNLITLGMLLGFMTMVFFNPEIIADKSSKDIKQVQKNPKNFLGID